MFWGLSWESLVPNYWNISEILAWICTDQGPRPAVAGTWISLSWTFPSGWLTFKTWARLESYRTSGPKPKLKSKQHIGKMFAICDKGQSPYYKKNSWKSIKDEYYNRKSATKNQTDPKKKMKRTSIREEIQHDRKAKKKVHIHKQIKECKIKQRDSSSLITLAKQFCFVLLLIKFSIGRVQENVSLLYCW